MQGNVRAGAVELGNAIRRGQFLSYGGPTVLNITSDFLEGLFDALAEPADAMHEIGRGWGWRWLERVSGFTGFYQATVQDLSLDDIQQLLEEDLVRSGWGRPIFDLDSYAEAGIILIEVAGGAVTALEGQMAEGIAMMLAGFFAGVFGSLAELPMAGACAQVQPPPLPAARIAVAHESLAAGIRAVVAAGGVWEEALEEAGRAEATRRE